jgi:hypothetical protein
MMIPPLRLVFDDSLVPVLMSVLAVRRRRGGRRGAG